MSRTLVGLLIGLWCADPAAAADDGVRLLELFQKTCGLKPDTGRALDALASPLGYVAKDTEALANEKSVDSYGALYHWRLPDSGPSFHLDVYLSGEPDKYQFACGIAAENVDGDALVAGLKAGMKLDEPLQETKPDSATITLTWKLGAKAMPDSLVFSLRSRGRSDIEFTYWVKKP